MVEVWVGSSLTCAQPGKARAKTNPDALRIILTRFMYCSPFGFTTSGVSRCIIHTPLWVLSMHMGHGLATGGERPKPPLLRKHRYSVTLTALLRRNGWAAGQQDERGPRHPALLNLTCDRSANQRGGTSAP